MILVDGGVPPLGIGRGSEGRPLALACLKIDLVFQVGYDAYSAVDSCKVSS